MPGARRARSLACSVENTRVSHHGHTGLTRHSPRNGFNGFLRALLGDRAFLPPSSAENSRQLDTSVGASGPHDFAVRLSAVRQRHRHVHHIPPRVRDDRDTPLLRDGTVADIEVIWVRRKPESFCKRGWTAKSVICPSGQITPSPHDFARCESPLCGAFWTQRGHRREGRSAFQVHDENVH